MGDHAGRARLARTSWSSRRHRIVAIIPSRRSRTPSHGLGGALDADERQDLVERLMRRTVTAAIASTAGRSRRHQPGSRGARHCLGSLVRGHSSSDRRVSTPARRRLARRAGQREPTRSSPADRPRVREPDASRPALAPITGGAPTGVVVLVTDRHGTGTNPVLHHRGDRVPVRTGKPAAPITMRPWPPARAISRSDGSLASTSIPRPISPG